MKRKRKAFMAVALSILVIAGCSARGGNDPASSQVDSAKSAGAAQSTETVAKPDKLKIQTSFYPMYEFTRQVAGELADVELLVPGGVEPHDWEPTPQDIQKIEESDVLVYNGAGMEGWVDQVKSAIGSGKLVTVEASQGLDLIEGTEEEHGDEHDHDHDHDHATGDHRHESGDEHAHDHGGLDPHVWLAPSLAAQEVRNIETALAKAAPDHKDKFKQNADAYISKLNQLDQEFKEGLAKANRKDFITQHAAFGYLAKQYGLTQVPIAGLSPDQEPSAEQMTEVIKFAKEHKVKTIFFETLVSSKVADAIASEIGAKTAVLNPIEGLTEEDEANKRDYLALMRINLESLQAALNE
ncbi:metal ABC transporter solute-binding protein, Zn/Mn family [Paenibacillus puldeungensis]|uniref:Metal ABC transporter solute-binding protein, Zn/Mn family n=1 Tax=Paenibacillus puldeungensis TaxID=696536 RepID=A0ABW3S2K0_9BACL